MGSPKPLRSASIIDGVRFTTTVALPNLAQGLFRRRRKVVAIAKTLDVDAQAVGLMRGLRRSHAPGPLKIRVAGKEALLLLSPRDIRRVLEESPEHFASDADPKGKGMRHFQPNALTISRGELWQDRRRFTEAALDTGAAKHRSARRFATVAADEIGRVLAPLGDDGRLDWSAWSSAFQRLTRRVVLGDSAADDQATTDLLVQLMDEANGLPSAGGPPAKYLELRERLSRYIAAAEKGSLAARAATAPQTAETDAAGQLPHWMFAMHDTLALNTWRALALLATHPDHRAAARKDPALLRACLEETMRLWPTTPMLARETLAETTWDGGTVPGGTQVLIVNTFFHRDPDHLPHADRLAPETWTQGRAGQDWSLNHFSHGPQGCPGAHIALDLGVAVLRAVDDARPDLRLVGGAKLDPGEPLPHALDPYGLRFA